MPFWRCKFCLYPHGPERQRRPLHPQRRRHAPGRGHRGPHRRRRAPLPAERPAGRTIRRHSEATAVNLHRRADPRQRRKVPGGRPCASGAAHARPRHVRDAQAVGVRHPRRQHQARRGRRHAAPGLLPPEHRRRGGDRARARRVQRDRAARGQARSDRPSPARSTYAYTSRTHRRAGSPKPRRRRSRATTR